LHYDEIVADGLKVFDEAKIDRRWLDLGGETQSQNRINRKHIDSLTIETRVLGSDFAETSATIFGTRIPAPIMPAAMISSRVMEKLTKSEVWLKRMGAKDTTYMEEFSKGVAEAGSIMWFGIAGESEVVPKMIKDGGKAIAIVKPMKDKRKNLDAFKWAEKIGCIAVGMDVDAMLYEKAFDEDEGPSYLGPQSLDDLKRYKSSTSLPFILKGILSTRDARMAKEVVGADALVVSNHGGEVIDYALPVLQALPAVREAIGKEMPIFVDGGMRRGSDAFKALALGANGVCFANLLVLAFAAHGRTGVAEMLRILYKELGRIMGYTGFKSIGEIESSIIHQTSF
jgi:4-hydroxymandelate oxidase